MPEHGLSEKDFGPDPIAEFGRWFADAQARSGEENPNAVALCTVGADGWPQGRMVLLKGWGPEGFCFYSNSRSEKGRALAANPRAELVFHWDRLKRQLRIQGGVEALGVERTQAYFSSRPRGSRLAAWASEQSEAVASREIMERRYEEVEKRFAGQEEIPAPPHWWGYRLDPRRMEFWQEGAARFHDRFVYLKEGAAWRFSRLNP